VDVQLDPSSAVVCRSVLLMLRLVIHPALSFSSPLPFWLCHFPNTFKYEILESIAFALLNFVLWCIFWDNMKLFRAATVAKGAQIS